MAIKIEYRNRPTNSKEYKLQKGVDRIIRKDPNGIFYYVVTFISSTSFGLNDFNLDVYRLKNGTKEYITTFHLGDEGKMNILVSEEEEDSSSSTTEEESPYSYHYSQHYL